jgi:pyruvate dehydrogenase (quinone)
MPQDIPTAYSKFEEMLGFKGYLRGLPDRLASAWQEALSNDRPVVASRADPEVVPLPPHVTLKGAWIHVGDGQRRYGPAAS